MRYHTLATDYDGTLATHGTVLPETLDALRRFRAAGGRTILVSGRELESLQGVFGSFELFDLMVLENGGLLYSPGTGEEWPLCEAPPLRLVEALRARSVHPLSVGRVIVATLEPHDQVVLECIHGLGLEHQVIFNKGAVMVLPSGVNKASGLKEALARMGLPAESTVGVGDAENDHALITLCGVGGAVANALPALKEHADYVCELDHGAGVVELIEHMLADTLQPHPRSPIAVEAEAVAARALGDPVDIHPNA
jgi:hydroxymethylpyrimidine pyrophosphatase-like HAD family hydrolase